eukprot:1261278-Rhodomonas_salina.5
MFIQVGVTSLWARHAAELTCVRGLCAQVYGPSGAGKSSALNAVLGEPELLPTNGMRACTATMYAKPGQRS